MTLMSGNLVILFSLFSLFVTFATPAKYIKITRYIPIVLSLVVLTSILLDLNANFTTKLLYISLTANVKAMALIFSLAMLAGSVFALQRFNKMELCFSVLYYLATLVVISTKSLLVLIVAWEAMAIAAAIIIFTNKTTESFKAGLKYTAMHFASGCLLLIGIAGLAIYGISTVENLILNKITIFILLAILINLAIVPFSSWLIDGYSSASYSASVFLSAFTTKASIVILFKFFTGVEVLVYVGMFISIYGALMACFIKDARKMLGYGIMAQVGIMVSLIGYGFHNIALLVAFTHILYKALMFMAIGSLMKATGSENANLNTLSFNYKHNKVIAAILVFASLTSLAFPFTATVAVKMLMSDALHSNYLDIYYIFAVIITILTVFGIGFKLPYFMFFNNKESKEHLKIHKHMYLGMGILIVASAVFTVAPFKMLSLTIDNATLSTFTYTNILTYCLKQVMYIVPSVLVFYFTRRFFAPSSFSNFSSNFLYKKLYLLYTKLENLIIATKAKVLGCSFTVITTIANGINTLTTQLQITNTSKTTTTSMLSALLTVFIIIIISLIVSL